MTIQWQLFVTPGLGDNSYLVYSADEAVLVDPQRDAWRFLEFASARKLRILYVLETHVHNDYVSGAIEIANATGARIVAPAQGRYEFEHLAVREASEIRIGSSRIVCLETPGHTQEHIAWLAYNEEDAPQALFSGGSLLVGGAGRTDLAGSEAASELTRKQWHSIQRLTKFPSTVQVLPTHGSGSFCASTPRSDMRITTLELEQKQNELLGLNEDEFIKKHLENPVPYPAYYDFMAPINRVGPPVLHKLPQLVPVTPEELKNTAAWVVDTRNRKDFASGHIAGSLNIELDESFATYAGWVVPFGSSIVLIANESNALADATTQLVRIGYDRLIGYLQGGVDAWMQQGYDVQSYATGTIQDLCEDFKNGRLRLIDVRQKNEWEEGHAKDSIHLFVGDLPRTGTTLASPPWSVACASGYRAALAASILDARGIPVRLIHTGGIEDFLKQCPEATAV